MLGADAVLRLIPDDVDFPELAAFDTFGSAAQEVRRVCEYASCRSVVGGGGGRSARFTC